MDPGIKTPTGGVAAQFGDLPVPALLWCWRFFLFWLLTQEIRPSSVKDSCERKNRGYSCKQQVGGGSFSFTGGSPSPRACRVLTLFGLLTPPRFPLNILIKRNCTEGSVSARAWRQVVKFLIEFSQQSQTKHKTALTQKCEGGGGGGGERREGSYFLCFSFFFLRLCSVFR